jgi:hypothetical protein
MRWLALVVAAVLAAFALATPAMASPAPTASADLRAAVPDDDDDEREEEDEDDREDAPAPAPAPAPPPPASAATAPAPAPPPAPAPETLAPEPLVDVSPLRLRRVSADRGRLRFHAIRPGRLVLRARRLDGRRRDVYTRTLAVRPGVNAIRLRDWLWGRRYRATLTAYDAAGNAAQPVRLTLRVR